MTEYIDESRAMSPFAKLLWPLFLFWLRVLDEMTTLSFLESMLNSCIVSYCIASYRIVSYRKVFIDIHGMVTA